MRQGNNSKRNGVTNRGMLEIERVNRGISRTKDGDNKTKRIREALKRHTKPLDKREYTSDVKRGMAREKLRRKE